MPCGYWLLMRMLYCPNLSPFKASSLLPGGLLKNSKLAALFSEVSFRSATDWIALNRLGEPPSNNAWVSLQRKDLIIVCSVLRFA